MEKLENFYFNFKKKQITLENNKKLKLNDSKAFQIISNAWLRAGWDTKYVYGFSWLGRPIIQLPEDLIRIQEIIYKIKPDIIIETGVAHGGSLVFYATLCKAIGKGSVIGIDIKIRKKNKILIEKNELSKFIHLIEGNSISKKTYNKVVSKIKRKDKILVILDSNHTKKHVLSELNMYSKLVSKNSYIVACDGIMKYLNNAPRTKKDWSVSNPIEAINLFLKNNKKFKCIEPKFQFNEGLIKSRVTYWPKAFLKRIK